MYFSTFLPLCLLVNASFLPCHAYVIVKGVRTVDIVFGTQQAASPSPHPEGKRGILTGCGECPIRDTSRERLEPKRGTPSSSQRGGDGVLQEVTSLENEQEVGEERGGRCSRQRFGGVREFPHSERGSAATCRARRMWSRGAGAAQSRWGGRWSLGPGSMRSRLCPLTSSHHQRPSPSADTA